MLGATLTGCASTGGQMFPDYSMTGEYPFNYKEIVEKEIGKDYKTLFIPKGYYQGWSSGWISCLRNEKTSELVAVVVKNNSVKKVVRGANKPDLEDYCAVVKATSDRDWMKRISVYAKELEKAKKAPNKEELFGKEPKHVVAITKGYMFDKLNNPVAAKFKNFKVTETYYTDADLDYKLLFAYSIEVQINDTISNSLNDRDNFGGYKKYYFLVKDNEVLEHLKSSFN